MATLEEAEATLTVAEKQALLRNRRSAAERTYRKVMDRKEIMIKGKGKGLEPKPWCECHNRNPCPIDDEIR